MPFSNTWNVIDLHNRLEEHRERNRDMKLPMHFFSFKMHTSNHRMNMATEWICQILKTVCRITNCYHTPVWHIGCVYGFLLIYFFHISVCPLGGFGAHFSGRKIGPHALVEHLSCISFFSLSFHFFFLHFLLEAKKKHVRIEYVLVALLRWLVFQHCRRRCRQWYCCFRCRRRRVRHLFRFLGKLYFCHDIFSSRLLKEFFPLV